MAVTKNYKTSAINMQYLWKKWKNRPEDQNKNFRRNYKIGFELGKYFLNKTMKAKSHKNSNKLNYINYVLNKFSES